MPTTYKVLGQVAPSAVTNTTLYTVPAATQTVISTISICNRGSSSAVYRIAIRIAGSALSDEEYIIYDAAAPAQDTIFLTLGISLAATDVVTVYTSLATLSFNAFGSEIT